MAYRLGEVLGDGRHPPPRDAFGSLHPLGYRRGATGSLIGKAAQRLTHLEIAGKYSEPKREDDRKNEHEDRYQNEKRIGPNQNITWGGGANAQSRRRPIQRVRTKDESANTNKNK